jgi:hypothetical protein
MAASLFNSRHGSGRLLPVIPTIAIFRPLYRTAMREFYLFPTSLIKAASKIPGNGDISVFLTLKESVICLMQRASPCRSYAKVVQMIGDAKDAMTAVSMALRRTTDLTSAIGHNSNPCANCSRQRFRNRTSNGMKILDLPYLPFLCPVTA